LFVGRRKFHGRDDVDAQRLGRLGGFGEGRHRVVIADRDARQPPARREGDGLAGGIDPSDRLVCTCRS
jgi:hypothetical protein